MIQSSLAPVEFRGFTVFCTAWAADRDGSVYFSLIGRVTAIQAVWAAFHSDYTLTDSGSIRKRPQLDGAKYHTIKSRLPDSGWAHWLVIHSQATEQNLADQDFFILAGDEQPPLDSFWSRWNRALPLPARRDWAPKLWQLGQEQDLIFKAYSDACICWRIEASRDNWADIITQLAKEDS
jgi:hypothetical protein